MYIFQILALYWAVTIKLAMEHMLKPKKIRILPVECREPAGSLQSQLLASALEALRYEKSTLILEKASTDRADFILPVGPFRAHELKGHNDSGAIPALCEAPAKHTANIAHTLAPGESLHGYFKQDQTLLALCHLPQTKPNTTLELRKILAPSRPEHQKTASMLRDSFNLAGPWHATAISSEKLCLYSYPSPTRSPLFDALGMNWYALAAFEAAGKSVSIMQQPIWGTAAFDESDDAQLHIKANQIYLDLDDTLIVHGALNPHVADLLARCVRANLPVHLITRHARDPHKTLQEFNIEAGKFASIIWVTDGSPKSNHMTASDRTMFIDDSFKERQEVSATLNILSMPPSASRLLYIR